MPSLQPQQRPEVEQTATATQRILRILAVIDGSERTGRIIEHVLSLAHHGRLEVILLGVARDPPEGRLRGYGSFKRQEIHARLKDVLGERAVMSAARRFDQAGVAHKERIEVGDPAETILRVASEEGCDLVLVGDAPAGAFRGWLAKVVGLSVATVASQVAQLADVPVTVVK
jgi:nucleotide-binding universal stress UspA family protein